MSGEYPHTQSGASEERARHALRLETARRELGPEHGDTLMAMSSLASVQDEEGDRAGARALREQVLEISRRTLGPRAGWPWLGSTGKTRAEQSGPR